MEQIFTYTIIAVVAAAATMLLLFITKIPTVVTIGSALLVGASVVTYARIDLGYWDPLAPIAFVTTTAFAFGVSFVLLLIGRRMRWPFFAPKEG